MGPLTEKLRQYLQIIVYLIIGGFASGAFWTYTFLISPVFLYRWILVKYIAPRFQPEFGKAVTANAQFVAAEFISQKQSPEIQYSPPRCAISCQAFVSGTLTYEQCVEVLTQGWLTKKSDETQLRYPEFQQYIVYWMGYMFWKKDSKFSLPNHIYQHNIPDSASFEECEATLKALTESLINKPFPANKSPWEFHLIHNCKNLSIRSLEEDEGTMTVIMFRFHHAMVDGFSVMYATIEGLLGQKIPLMEFAKPSDVSNKSNVSFSVSWSNVKNVVYLLFKIIRDVGYLVRLEMRYNRENSTPWYCPDKKKNWVQICDKTKPIPIDKIKFIKNQFGVSFTTTLFSAMAAGAASHFKKKKSESRKLPTFVVVPRPGHPNKLRNHILASALELNVSPELSPAVRLLQTELDFLEARHNSEIPRLSLIVSTVLSAHPAKLAKFFLKNRSVHTLLTNFPGPGLQLKFLERPVLSLEFYIGALNGISGSAFSVVSYNGHIKIAVTAEEGIINREELAELISTMENEIEILYNNAVTSTKGITIE